MEENHELEPSPRDIEMAELKENRKRVAERDEADLLRLGKKTVLKVRLCLSGILIFSA